MVQVVGVIELHLHGRTHKNRRSFGLLAQKRSHAAALVVLDQLAGELLLEPLALFAAGQKQVAFHLHQPRGHLDEGAGGFRVRVGPRHRGGVLVDQLQNGDVVQVHLMFGHKRQQ